VLLLQQVWEVFTKWNTNKLWMVSLESKDHIYISTILDFLSSLAGHFKFEIVAYVSSLLQITVINYLSQSRAPLICILAVNKEHSTKVSLIGS
jgi:hypothetical protein